MAKRKCPMCAERIQAEAQKCKHCGAGIPPPEKPKSRTGCLLAVLVGLLLFVALLVILAKPSPQPDSSDDWKPRTVARDSTMTRAKVAADIPSYTVADRTKLMGGGLHLDVLLSRAQRKALSAERERIARSIAAKEAATQVSMYCSKAAMKANYSEKYAKRNPKASRCQLGALIDGRFFMP